MKAHFPLLVFVLLTVLTAQASPAGEDTTEIPGSRYPKSAGFSLLYGKVINTHAFVKGDNPQQEPYKDFFALTATYGINTDGRKMWQQLYGYPQWGFGVFKGFLLNDYDQLGNPAAVYAFFRAPFIRWKKWSLNYDVGFGISFNWNRHDIIEQGYYYPIGTYSTVYFSFALGAGFQLDKHLELSTNLTYTHFSNGAVRLPNLGINLISPQVSLQYLFGTRPDFIRKEIPQYQKEWEWIVLLAPSMRQESFNFDSPSDDSLRAVAFDYAILTLSTSFNRQISHMVKFGAGFDLTYNEAYGATMVVVDGQPQKGPPLPFGDQLLLGVFPSFELVINQLSLVVQPGFYVYRKDIPLTETPTSYQRIGIKYHLFDHLVVGLNIRAFNFSKADFIEWIIGYRLKWQKTYRKK